ncbi:hypothetical protein QNI16_07615 [Cytophagaceae bacterium YF14B1]|uniref:Uncharacterized protein n=1 Tax=Xanthocytophaga flava TaxID=3048013 RepID=A0AAE3U698_9BACT|nr:hypothetical protein [Xanthocytophaga flavus]MDJ1480347.1 hypothetical protein [Xanthocytophaga flavus]
MRNNLSNEIAVLLNVIFGRSGSLATLRTPFSVAVTQKPFRPNFKMWAARSYKPLTVFVLSALVLLLCYVKAGFEILSVAQTAIMAGAGCIILSILLSPEWTRKAVIKFAKSALSLSLQLSPSKAFSHVGSLIISMNGLMLVYANHHSQFAWTVYPTLSLLGGFALGSSAIMLLINALDREDIHKPAMVRAEVLKKAHHLGVMPERMDVLGGAVVAGILLGTTLVEINTSNMDDLSLTAGVVWLPVVLAWCGICTSVVMGYMLKHADLPAAIKRILNVLVMMVVAYTSVVTMMPAYWVVEGKEILSSEIFLAAGLGTIGSFLLWEANYAYQWLRTHYYDWVINKLQKEFWYLRPLRHLFRMICLTIPVILIGWFMKQAFDHVGLYGIIIATIALLSNLNVQLPFKRTITL